MKPEMVFLPDGIPTVTYVRRDGDLEQQLDDALAQGKVISIVGASKTGKTTLCERRCKENRALVLGSRVRTADDVWDLALAAAGGARDERFELDPIGTVTKLLKEREWPLILDDFHYVDRSVQGAIARQIKNAAQEGLRVVVVNLPHRSDDPIRANRDLSGRVCKIDCGFWKTDDLKRIATTGFPEVGATVVRPLIDKLAEESLTSPQIMQTLCLELCRAVGLTGDEAGPRTEVTEAVVSPSAVLSRAVRAYDNETLVSKLQQGPRRRGRERDTFKFSGGGSGDVYELLVRAIALDPPSLSFSFDDLRSRAQTLTGKAPTSLWAALGQWSKLQAKDEQRPVEWDADRRRLSILDPHFYFFVRHTRGG